MIANLDEPVHSPRLLDAVFDHGGIISAEGLSQVLRSRRSQPLSAVARWIVRRDVVSIPGRGSYVLPLFQFRQPELEPLPVVHLVIEELSAIFDEVELANWFFRPSVWLDGCLPVCAVHERGNAVHRAARADRWAMRG